MQILISPTKEANGRQAAACGAIRLRDALRERGEAAIIVATGASQLEMLEALLAEPGISWDKVTVFHLDEYISLPVTHPASFRKYLWERFHRRLPVPVRAFHYVAGDANPEQECARLSALISKEPIDICFAGIGENAHLAFNDPPADLQTQVPYLIVELDEACRRQQLGEGWFGSLDEVPRRAITMSIHRILQSRCIVITAPDTRKAQAALDSFAGEVKPEVPASILRNHADTHIFLDEAAAALLRPV